MILEHKEYTVKATDGANYTLIKETQTVKGKNPGKRVENTLGYHVSMGMAMKGIIKDMEASDQSTVDMEGYLQQYKNLTKELIAASELFQKDHQCQK